MWQLIRPMTTLQTRADTYPVRLNAWGRKSMPLPIEAFSKCINTAKSLSKQRISNRQLKRSERIVCIFFSLFIRAAAFSESDGQKIDLVSSTNTSFIYFHTIWYDVRIGNEILVCIIFFMNFDFNDIDAQLERGQSFASIRSNHVKFIHEYYQCQMYLSQDSNESLDEWIIWNYVWSSLMIK